MTEAQPAAAEAAAPDGGTVEIPPLEERIGIFRLDAFRLGVRGDACSGLQQVPSPRPLPRSAPHVLGVTHLRGKIVPIFDLGIALDLYPPDHQPRQEALPIGLVVEVGGRTAVLAAQEIVTFEIFDLHQLSELGAHVPPTLRKYGRGQLRHRGREIVLLAIGALLEALRGHDLRGPDDGSTATSRM